MNLKKLGQSNVGSLIYISGVRVPSPCRSTFTSGQPSTAIFYEHNTKAKDGQGSSCPIHMWGVAPSEVSLKFLLIKIPEYQIEETSTEPHFFEEVANQRHFKNPLVVACNRECAGQHDGSKPYRSGKRNKIVSRFRWKLKKAPRLDLTGVRVGIFVFSGGGVKVQ